MRHGNSCGRLSLGAILFFAAFFSGCRSTPFAPSPPQGTAAATPPPAAPRQSDAEGQVCALTTYFENDTQGAKPNHPTDRYYTNGLEMAFHHQPPWARDFANWLPGRSQFGDDMRTGAGYLLGQIMFTPEDLYSTTLVTNDRPYAGYLYAGVYADRQDDFRYDRVQLDVGIVGPHSYAEDLQLAAHGLFQTFKPRGWANQLPDELEAELYLRRKWRFNLYESADGGAFKIQAIPEAGAALGTVYDSVEGGSVFRLGYHLPDDFGPGRLADVADAAEIPQPGWSVYLFGRATGRAVAHNILVQGTNWRSSPGVGLEHTLAEGQFGIDVRHTWKSGIGFEATYSQTYQSKEFTLQRGSHSFGSFTLMLFARF